MVENHLNMVKASNGEPKVAPGVLAAVLNSDVADQVFRCINGSVAVSAYEMAASPLPSPEDTAELAALVGQGARRDALERRGGPRLRLRGTVDGAARDVAGRAGSRAPDRDLPAGDAEPELRDSRKWPPARCS